MKPTPQNLYELLVQAASTSSTAWPHNGITVYPPGQANKVGRQVSYADVLRRAQSNTRLLHSIEDIFPNSVILLHFNNHLDSIEWFWTATIAGYLPAISPPFVNDLEQRKKHLIHIQNLLHKPIIITTDSLLHEFDGMDGLTIYTAEKLRIQAAYADYFPLPKSDTGHSKRADDLAVLMLTSGSTGNAKAVGLRQEQILRAMKAKSEYHGTHGHDTFLNWIGLDHVANLTEIHLHAMYLGANQVHVQAADLLANPLTFLRLINNHKAAYTFAPNFFLASLRRSIEDTIASNPDYLKDLDLSSLRALISGGEANVVATCKALSDLLKKLKAGKHAIRPGFGMTETCAGSIYGKNCPTYDLDRKLEFTSLGNCVPDIQMRVVTDHGSIASQGEHGNLEVSGKIVFKGYYNNPKATAEAFTRDGWFITGDRAFIDDSGCLNLAGRAKESIIINGVKYFPQELETAIEEASIDGVTPSYTVVFPHRPKNHQTEVVVVVYLPSYDPNDVPARVAATDAISKVALMQCGVRPYQVIALDQQLLPKSSLGKLSRMKIRTAFENGEYSAHQDANNRLIDTYRAAHFEGPSTETERIILKAFCELFDVPVTDFGVNTSLLDLGVNSIEIIRLKQLLQDRLGLEAPIPVILILTNPSIRGLANALGHRRGLCTYNPIVTLQSQGTKTPLWLIHPGVGEVLVFLTLAKYITDRPVYALRARGFDGDEEFFKDIPDAVSTYHDAIKKVQPKGPYAIAGYSYGAMLAFETAKVLEAEGDEIRFLGSFNLPPHIKTRMRQLDWIEVVLNLSYFLDLITDAYAHEISPQMHQLSHEEVVDFIIEHAAPQRMGELALDKEKLSKWADLAHALQGMAQDYEPTGNVASIDVFYAIPLSAVAKSKEDWVSNYLSKWSDFARSQPRFHEVEGAHYTMIGPEHVSTFQRKLRAVLHDRGL